MKQKYRLLHYSGTTDGAVPTHGTKQWIKAQNFTVTNAQRQWNVNGKPAGHITEYGNFWFATVHDTGHMAPQWKRQEVYELVSNFIHEQPIK